MTAVRTAPGGPTVAAGPVGFGPPPVSPRRARNVAGALLGLLLVVFCASAVALYASHVGGRRAVLAIARPVKAGAVITGADLTEARVSADPALHPVPVSARNEIVGKVAAVSLVPGTLVTRAEIATGPAVESGSAVVGLALKAGQFPSGVRALDRVMLVLVAPPDSGAVSPTPAGGPSSPAGSATAGSVLVPDVRVASVTSSPDGQTTVISVVMPVSAAPAVVGAAARSEVSLALLGGPAAG